MLFWSDLGVNGIRHDATLHMDPSFVKGLKDVVDSRKTVTHFGEFFIGRPDPKYDEYVYFPKQTGVNNLDFEFYRAASSKHNIWLILYSNEQLCQYVGIYSGGLRPS